MLAYRQILNDMIAAPTPNAYRILAITFLACIYIFNSIELRQWVPAEIPTGPDQQCYHRQAQLFDERGMIGGLDTAVTFEGAYYLLKRAKALGFFANPEPDWIVTVAPECHRYKQTTDKIISQYPPGTGFLLSLFPEGRRARVLYIAIETIVFAWFVYLLWFARNSGAVLLLCALGSFTAIQLNYEGYMSFSLAPSMLLCMLLAFCTVKMLTCKAQRRRVLLAAICGGLLGISVSVRTANLLLAGAYMLAFGDIYLRKRWREIFAVALAFGIALFIALIPSLAANAINAGSPFATTYGGEDAARPIFTWAQITAAVDYHFFGEGIGYVFDAGLTLTILFEIARRFLRLKTIPYLSFINIATWTIAAAYYMTHSILNSYYIIPTALFSISLIVFGFCEIISLKRTSEKEGYGTSRVAVAAMISACGVMTITAWAVTLDEGPKQGSLLPSLQDSAIVWADGSGGLFSYYLKHHTAMLGRASDSIQSLMVGTIAEDGRTQYFIADGEQMRKLINHIPGLLQVENMFGYETFRLEARRTTYR
jgi:hypothetical protein